MSAKIDVAREGELPLSANNLFCQSVLQEREFNPTTAPESRLWTVGTKVLWKIIRNNGSGIIPGTIERDNGDGTYDIEWTYGGWRRTPELGKSVDETRVRFSRTSDDEMTS